MLISWNKNTFTAFMAVMVIFLCIKKVEAVGFEPEGFSFDNDKIEIEGSLRPFTSSIEIEELNMRRFLVKIYLHAQTPSAPPSFSVKINFPKDNINQLWNSQTWSNKSYFTMPSYDRAAASFAIVSGLTINDQNQITFTSRDRYENRFINTFVQEKGDTLVFGLGLFEDNPPISQIQDYEVQILVDFRNVHFSNAIYEASKWRLADKFQSITTAVDTSKVPVYSTWYPMHRNIPLENISRELDSLSAFNFKSILVDDGWRSLVKMKIDTVYNYDEESFEIMTDFNQKRKDLGLKLYLWYSFPFLGGNPAVSEKFEGKYLHYKAPLQNYVLDPRYPEVRKHLISTYANFYSNWMFDGFWFDFLSNFYPPENISVNDDLGRDYTDVGIALDSLTNELNKRLKSINPNIFMGNKFASVGPNRSNYENFLAGFVGVNSIKIVREKMVNNRLLYGSKTPFLEIMGVHPRDKSIEVARKFQAIMYGNPYLSFYITTMPEDNKQTIRFWLEYWKKNYDVIMKGDFEPIKVARQYPAIHVENKTKSIYTLYEDYTLALPYSMTKTLDVINSKESELLNFVISQPGMEYSYEIYNHLGAMTEKDILKTKRKNTVEFLIPSGGFIRFL
ncbi:hypothetical protein ACUNWD_01650 [Sunxiuqinia sp. A32]|uniref:hypothetical protein n=1 Tax=Sunxiuqinia sp. A32 TaxID=3461496 RepID=UPI0040462F6B